MNIEADRLAVFEATELSHGKHASLSSGACALELVSYLANEPWSDRPACACPVLTGYVISLNDNWTTEQRQRLKPFLPRLLGTRSTPDVESRRGIAALDWTMRVHRPLWLDAAGLGEYATRLRALPEIVDEAMFRPAAKIQEESIAGARATMDARAAMDARTARDAWAARDARGAWAIWATWAARDAWATWDAGGAMDARTARDAWAAWDARGAWATWDAWAARAAIGTLIALNAGNSLGPDATTETRREVGTAALNSVLADVQTAELELLGRMIEIKP